MLIYTRTKSKKYKRPGQGEVAKKLPKRKFKEKSKPVEQRYRAPGSEQYPSRIHQHLLERDPVHKKPLKYEDEDLARREAIAQEEIQRKAKCVAPAFNKGNYTYIATEEQAKWVGRK